MEYRCYGDTYVIRLETGEEICQSLMQLARVEGIALAEIGGLGAVDDFTVGVFDIREKRFYSNVFQGSYEIVSLTGTITEQDGQPYLHAHMSAADPSGRAVGGHLSRAVISVTAELTVRVLNGHVGRRHDARMGINLLEFD